MIRALTCVAAILMVSMALAGDPETAAKVVIWTGWFSDSECASARATGDTVSPTNPDCAKRCIEKGVAPVFLSEQAKAIFLVKGYPTVIDDLGYHLEIEGRADEAARTIEVLKVKRLEYEGSVCGRPTKPPVRK